ncbi:MAG: hypothetical protein WBV55_16145, partial [Candidatus Sulfotelmatobacter sp.]
TAPADFRVANLQAVRGSNSKAGSFLFTVAMVEETSVWMDDPVALRTIVDQARSGCGASRK